MQEGRRGQACCSVPPVQDGNTGLMSINFTALVGAKAFVEKIEKWRGDLDCHPQGRKNTLDNAQRSLYFARCVSDTACSK